MNHTPAVPGAYSGDDGNARHVSMSPLLRERLDAVTAAARAELISASEKRAGLLLSWAGVAYGVMVTLVLTGPARFPGIGRFGVMLALILLSVAVMLILLTVRPLSARHGGQRILAYADEPTPQALIKRMNAETKDYELFLATDALQFARIARIKHRNLRWSVDLIITGITVMTATVFLERLI
ncbi:Pycsar system effector family protein [Streptosporangium roseum]|uniref:Pycsar system effector family protein n=1 Tax=Streptosporangium roseum TaxID=2001 RepID=UPI0004CD8CF5|nr:Pycsar system effector family protein [Streptosporangium roseum]